MTFRRRWTAGVLSAAACAAMAFGASVRQAIAAAPLSRQTLAARWSTVNDRPGSDLSPAGRWSAPPKALPVLAARELSGPRYRLAASPGQSRAALPWWLQVWQWLTGRWRAFWSSVFGTVRIGRGQTVVVGDVLLALAAAAVFVAALRLLSGVILERAPGGRTVAAASGAPQWYAGACERARRGDYAAAAQWLFAAALASLSARGLLDEDRSRTVGEFREALAREESGLLPAFDAVAREFVAATYAQTVVGAAQWDRAHDGYLALEQAGQS